MADEKVTHANGYTTREYTVPYNEYVKQLKELQTGNRITMYDEEKQKAAAAAEHGIEAGEPVPRDAGGEVHAAAAAVERRAPERAERGADGSGGGDG